MLALVPFNTGLGHGPFGPFIRDRDGLEPYVGLNSPQVVADNRPQSPQAAGAIDAEPGIICTHPYGCKQQLTVLGRERRSSGDLGGTQTNRWLAA